MIASVRVPACLIGRFDGKQRQLHGVVAWILLVLAATRVGQAAPVAEGEEYFFVPSGFSAAGKPVTASGEENAKLTITVRDAATGQPTPCRLNVIGPDGNFYQPPTSELTDFALTGEWPQQGKGNRREKAPYRYLGRFFYSRGSTTLAAPAGKVRVEASKGFEFAPQSAELSLEAGKAGQVELTLRRTANARELGYTGGDPHLHFRRQSERDEQTIFDLLMAEDIQYASLLAYNEPAGPYHGVMDRMDSPQGNLLGAASETTRGDYRIASGQEYRTSTYGHLNLFWRQGLVFPGKSFNADRWPVYGEVAAETRGEGGFAVYAHGGYAQEIYADAALGHIDAVELLQFGIYRGIGLEDWYHLLNSGYRFPAVGASDYPACRFLGDCRTYVGAPSPDSPASAAAMDFHDWLSGMAAGRSFVTTGPLLLMDVAHHRPGDQISLRGSEPHTLDVVIRVRSEVAPVQRVQLIANGKVIDEQTPAAAEQQGAWFEVRRQVKVSESSWLAARAFGTTPGGQPDAESHTNPVYVYVDDRAPYVQESLDAWVARIDKQIGVHTARDFPEKAQVLAYFQKARDQLLQIRGDGGLRTDQIFQRPVVAHDEKGPRKSPLLSRPSAERSAPTSVAEKPPSAGGPSGSPRQRDLAKDGSVPDVTDEELKEFLRPLPPKSPAEALKTFETAGDFHLELVAAEPLVVDPISAAFDADGNLYVTEMRDYPFKPAEGEQPLGTVRLLRDTDGDGQFDEGHVFAEHLLWAGGVAPWRGGVFVAAPPDIWYFRDTDGDYRADLREKVFTGFGTENQQAMLNNLVWWLDHKIYGSTAGNGGNIRPGDKPEAPAVSVQARDFRFSPATSQFEAITGTVQFGNTFDDWGNRFLCSESQPLHHVVLPQEYLERNPFLAVPRAIQNVTPGPVPIYRISPVERWRHIRSSRRIAKNERAATSPGASHHVIDAAAGVTIYRGGAYPPDYYGNVFIADGQNNLIHRRILEPQGVSFSSRRADEGKEFVRSSDIWFRPVNFLNAPDGTLYCLDMSREYLEAIHIPLDVVKHLNLASGRDQGRIYRIAPHGFQSPPPPRLGQASVGELVAALESPHGWWRDTAHRLLYERQDRTAVPALRKLAAESRSPQARLYALWSLEGLNALTEDDLKQALHDPVAGVRENALRLGEPFLARKNDLLGVVIELLDDPDPRVRLQLAFTLGASSDQRAARALAQFAQQAAGDEWMRTAVLSSVGSTAGSVFLSLLESLPNVEAAANHPFLPQLVTLVGTRHQPQEMGEVLNAITRLGQSKSAAGGVASLQEKWLFDLADGLRRARAFLPSGDELSREAQDMLKRVVAQARARAADSAADPMLRQPAIRFLGATPWQESHDVLLPLLQAGTPASIQTTVLQILAGYSQEGIDTAILDSWDSYEPEVRLAAVDVLLSREAWTLALLEFAREKPTVLPVMDVARRETLRSHPQPPIRELAQEIFGAAGASRASVLADYRESLRLEGQPDRGIKVFERICANCHQIGGKGFVVGPNLASNASRDRDTLLLHILDPNQYVLPNYQQYRVIDVQGRIFTGLLAAQSATSVTLKRERDQADTILRSQIDELVCLGKSLMPEGLEKELSKQDLADVMSYLQQAAANASTSEDDIKTRDFGTLPGLVEPPRNSK